MKIKNLILGPLLGGVVLVSCDEGYDDGDLKDQLAAQDSLNEVMIDSLAAAHDAALEDLQNDLTTSQADLDSIRQAQVDSLEILLATQDSLNADQIDSLQHVLDSLMNNFYGLNTHSGPIAISMSGRFTSDDSDYSFSSEQDYTLDLCGPEFSTTISPTDADGIYSVVVALSKNVPVGGLGSISAFTFEFDPALGQSSIEEFQVVGSFLVEIEALESSELVNLIGHLNSVDGDDNVSISSFSYDAETQELDISFAISDTDGSNNSTTNALNASFSFSDRLSWAFEGSSCFGELLGG